MQYLHQQITWLCLLNLLSMNHSWMRISHIMQEPTPLLDWVHLRLVEWIIQMLVVRQPSFNITNGNDCTAKVIIARWTYSCTRYKGSCKDYELTQEIVRKHHITCLMVTHQMQQALEVGDRTIMMNDGHIAIDIKGEQRANMSVYDLMECFHANIESDLEDDHILLAKQVLIQNRREIMT